jgi:hypothetical protein
VSASHIPPALCERRGARPIVGRGGVCPAAVFLAVAATAAAATGAGPPHAPWAFVVYPVNR